MNLRKLAADLEPFLFRSGSGARVYNSANISVANASFTALTFNSERWDDDSFHDTGSNTSRLTVPQPGRYLVTACVRFAANATGNRQLRLMVDGGTEVARVTAQAVTGGIATMLEVETITELGAGSYFTVEAYQDSGGALNVEATGNSSPEFWISTL